jgi:hypothetical protein
MRDFPSVILNTPKTRLALFLIFNYESKFYNLDAYEKIQKGLGKQVWLSFQEEMKHQEWIDQKFEMIQEKINKPMRPWYYFDWLWPI